jgi:hypothetical protein
MKHVVTRQASVGLSNDCLAFERVIGEIPVLSVYETAKTRTGGFLGHKVTVRRTSNIAFYHADIKYYKSSSIKPSPKRIQKMNRCFHPNQIMQIYVALRLVAPSLPPSFLLLRQPRRKQMPKLKGSLKSVGWPMMLHGNLMAYIRRRWAHQAR